MNSEQLLICVYFWYSVSGIEASKCLLGIRLAHNVRLLLPEIVSLLPQWLEGTNNLGNQQC